jgi:hypothetical protein
VEEGVVKGKTKPGKWNYRSNTKKRFPGSWRFLEPSPMEDGALDMIAGGPMPETEEEWKKYMFRTQQAMTKMMHYLTYTANKVYTMSDQNSRLINENKERNRRLGAMEKQIEALRSKVGGPIVEQAGRKLLPVENEKPGDTKEMKQRADRLIARVSNGYI